MIVYVNNPSVCINQKQHLIRLALRQAIFSLWRRLTDLDFIATDRTFFLS